MVVRRMIQVESWLIMSSSHQHSLPSCPRLQKEEFRQAYTMSVTWKSCIIHRRSIDVKSNRINHVSYPCLGRGIVGTTFKAARNALSLTGYMPLKTGISGWLRTYNVITPDLLFHIKASIPEVIKVHGQSVSRCHLASGESST